MPSRIKRLLIYSTFIILTACESQYKSHLEECIAIQNEKCPITTKHFGRFNYVTYNQNNNTAIFNYIVVNGVRDFIRNNRESCEEMLMISLILNNKRYSRELIAELDSNKTNIVFSFTYNVNEKTEIFIPHQKLHELTEKKLTKEDLEKRAMELLLKTIPSEN